MKYLLIIILSATLFSCTQDPSIMATGSGEPEISFDINGTHYAHIGAQTVANGGIGIYAVKVAGVPGATNTIYSFTGGTNIGNIIQIIIGTPNDTLKTTTYHLSGATIKANNENYVFTGSGNYLDVVITGYQIGTVNGTFSGSLSKLISANPYVTQPATLTNGVIKNVSIRY